MTVKQLSVFIENREGRLGEVLHVLKKSDVNILSMSLADTTEYGLLRLIVSDPKLGKEKLAEDGFSTMLTDVIVLKINHEAGSLQGLLGILSESDINIEYMYAFANGADASAVLKSDNPEKVVEILKRNGFDVYSADEAYHANI